MNKLLLLLTTLVLSFNISYGQDEVQPSDANPEIKLETRKEKKAYRNQLMDEFQGKLSKHFNVPCSSCWYFTVRGGYGVPFLTLRNEAPFDFLGNSDYQFLGNGQVSDKVLYGTAGQGYRFGLGLGKMFNTFIGFELYLNYNNYTGETLGNIEDQYYSSSLVAKAFDLSLMPQLVLQSPNLNNVYLFAKIGAMIPFFGHANIDVNVDDREGRLISVLAQDEPIGPLIHLLEETGLTKEILTGDLGDLLGYRSTISAQTRAEFISDNLWETLRTIIGFTAVAGMRYQFSDLVSISAELRYTGYHVSLATNRVENLTGTIELLGQTIEIEADDLPYGTFNFDYKPELTEESNNPVYNPKGYDDTKPREELPYRTSTSVLSGNIGLQVNIPTKQQRAEKKGMEWVNKKQYKQDRKEYRKDEAEKYTQERKDARDERREEIGIKPPKEQKEKIKKEKKEKKEKQPKEKKEKKSDESDN